MIVFHHHQAPQLKRGPAGCSGTQFQHGPCQGIDRQKRGLICVQIRKRWAIADIPEALSDIGARHPLPRQSYFQRPGADRAVHALDAGFERVIDKRKPFCAARKGLCES